MTISTPSPSSSPSAYRPPSLPLPSPSLSLSSSLSTIVLQILQIALIFMTMNHKQFLLQSSLSFCLVHLTVLPDLERGGGRWNVHRPLHQFSLREAVHLWSRERLSPVLERASPVAAHLARRRHCHEGALRQDAAVLKTTVRLIMHSHMIMLQAL